MSVNILIQSPMSSMLGTQSGARWGVLVVLQLLEYLHMHNEVSCGQDPSVNMKSTMPLSLKVILYSIFRVPAF